MMVEYLQLALVLLSTVASATGNVKIVNTTGTRAVNSTNAVARPLFYANELKYTRVTAETPHAMLLPVPWEHPLRLQSGTPFKPSPWALLHYAESTLLDSTHYGGTINWTMISPTMAVVVQDCPEILSLTCSWEGIIVKFDSVASYIAASQWVADELVLVTEGDEGLCSFDAAGAEQYHPLKIEGVAATNLSDLTITYTGYRSTFAVVASYHHLTFDRRAAHPLPASTSRLVRRCGTFQIACHIREAIARAKAALAAAVEHTRIVAQAIKAAKAAAQQCAANVAAAVRAAAVKAKLLADKATAAAKAALNKANVSLSSPILSLITTILTFPFFRQKFAQAAANALKSEEAKIAAAAKAAAKKANDAIVAEAAKVAAEALAAANKVAAEVRFFSRV